MADVTSVGKLSEAEQQLVSAVRDYFTRGYSDVNGQHKDFAAELKGYDERFAGLVFEKNGQRYAVISGALGGANSTTTVKSASEVSSGLQYGFIRQYNELPAQKQAMKAALDFNSSANSLDKVMQASFEKFDGVFEAMTDIELMPLVDSNYQQSETVNERAEFVLVNLDKLPTALMDSRLLGGRVDSLIQQAQRAMIEEVNHTADVEELPAPSKLNTPNEAQQRKLASPAPLSPSDIARRRNMTAGISPAALLPTSELKGATIQGMMPIAVAMQRAEPAEKLPEIVQQAYPIKRRDLVADMMVDPYAALQREASEPSTAKAHAYALTGGKTSGIYPNKMSGVTDVAVTGLEHASNSLTVHANGDAFVNAAEVFDTKKVVGNIEVTGGGNLRLELTKDQLEAMDMKREAGVTTLTLNGKTITTNSPLAFGLLNEKAKVTGVVTAEQVAVAMTGREGMPEFIAQTKVAPVPEVTEAAQPSDITSTTSPQLAPEVTSPPQLGMSDNMPKLADDALAQKDAVVKDGSTDVLPPPKEKVESVAQVAQIETTGNANRITGNESRIHIPQQSQRILELQVLLNLRQSIQEAQAGNFDTIAESYRKAHDHFATQDNDPSVSPAEADRFKSAWKKLPTMDKEDSSKLSENEKAARNQLSFEHARDTWIALEKQTSDQLAQLMKEEKAGTKTMDDIKKFMEDPKHRVFLDSNNDGRLDAGNTRAVTAAIKSAEGLSFEQAKEKYSSLVDKVKLAFSGTYKVSGAEEVVAVETPATPASMQPEQPKQGMGKREGGVR